MHVIHETLSEEREREREKKRATCSINFQPVLSYTGDDIEIPSQKRSRVSHTFHRDISSRNPMKRDRLLGSDFHPIPSSMDPLFTSLETSKRTAEGRHQAVEVRCYFMTINRDYDTRVSAISEEQETRRRLNNNDDQVSIDSAYLQCVTDL